MRIGTSDLCDAGIQKTPVLPNGSKNQKKLEVPGFPAANLF